MPADESASSGAGESTDGDAAPPATLPETPPTDTEPPVITIIGNNPAEVDVGSTYSDPGATVSDNVSKNLGLTYEVDGVAVVTVVIDTSAAGEHTVTYRARDQEGNSAEATRVVHVIAPLVVTPAAPVVPEEGAMTAEALAADESSTTETATGSEAAASMLVAVSQFLLCVLHELRLQQEACFYHLSFLPRQPSIRLMT